MGEDILFSSLAGPEFLLHHCISITRPFYATQSLSSYEVMRHLHINPSLSAAEAAFCIPSDSIIEVAEAINSSLKHLSAG